MSMRILIVDDNRQFVRAASELLTREGAIVVGSALDGGQARHQVRALAPEVVLLDVAIGSENGFVLARELDAEFGTNTPQMILISTHSAADFTELLDTTPAHGFLSKADLSADAVSGILSGSQSRRDA